MDAQLDLYVVLTTFPDENVAKRTAREMVRKRLSLCAQVDSAMESIYMWEGDLCEDREVRVLFKCLKSSLLDLEEAVLALHPYDCPQWICLKSDRVSDSYGSWAISEGGAK